MDFHGGNIYKIFREKNIKEILDYSSNINPYGVPESLKQKIAENIGILERYPDPDYVELREKLAQRVSYFGKEVDKPVIGDKIKDFELEDIKKNIKIMYAASFLSLVVFSVISVGIL